MQAGEISGSRTAQPVTLVRRTSPPSVEKGWRLRPTVLEQGAFSPGRRTLSKVEDQKRLGPFFPNIEPVVSRLLPLSDFN